MDVYDVLREGPTIRVDDKWLEFTDDIWTVKRLKAGTTHEEYMRNNGPEILYEGPDETTACEILLNE